MSTEYEKKLKAMAWAKIFALKNLAKYRKAVPIVRIEDCWFEETKFKINYDLTSFPIFPMVYFHIGDVFRIKFDFYTELMKHLPPENWNGPWPLDWASMISLKAVWDDNEFFLTAFVEMNSKHGREIFCALSTLPNTEYIHSDIVEAKDKSSLLLVWPQSLEKIEKK